jgi:hypothetical protein
MNLDDLNKKLLAAARANPPGDHVPFAFEKRITALLKSRPLQDPLSLWAHALWRAAAPCAALMLLLGAWSFMGSKRTATTTDSFEDQFVDTMLVLDQVEETL